MSPEALARLHAASFTRPRPWSADEFAGLLAGSGAFLLTDPHGFLLGRIIADEAELLTLAVNPACRRQGIATRLLEGFTDRAIALGATDAFLEVAADNAPARALYVGAGWRQAGSRRDYYAPGIDAIIMTLGPTIKTG